MSLLTRLIRCPSSSSRRCYSMTSMIDQIILDISKDSTKNKTTAISRLKPKLPQQRVSNDIQPVFKPKLDRINIDDDYNGQNRRNNNRYRSNRRQQTQLQFTSGTERLQQLFLTVFKKIKEVNPRGRVLQISPNKGGGVIRTNILKIFDGLDLDKEGVEVIKVEEEDGEQIPLVKIVDLKRAGQLYSDYLHEQVTLSSGLVPKYKNEPSQQKDGKVKQYKLSWHLSLHDLANVKLKEIHKQVLKNNKVEIFLGSKRDLRQAGENFIVEKKPDDDVAVVVVDEIEKIKRDKIVDTILQFVETQNETNKLILTQKGSTVDRLLITLKLEKPIEKKSNKKQK